jgi:hypothetical protein
MRRAQTIFAIVVLLALPLALLADGGDGMAGGCNRYCCLAHGRHATAPSGTSVTKARGEMRCHHSAAGKTPKCCMQGDGSRVEFAAAAPLPPTRPGLLVSLTAPAMSRRDANFSSDVIPCGYLAEPFEPPRA